MSEPKKTVSKSACKPALSKSEMTRQAIATEALQMALRVGMRALTVDLRRKLTHLAA